MQTNKDNLFSSKKGVDIFNFNSTDAGQKSIQKTQGIKLANLLNNLTIESVDSEGKNTLINIFGNDYDANGRSSGGTKFKRKSELKHSIASKSRISIKGENQYSYILNEEDPFIQSRSSVAGFYQNKQG